MLRDLQQIEGCTVLSFPQKASPKPSGDSGSYVSRSEVEQPVFGEATAEMVVTQRGYEDFRTFLQDVCGIVLGPGKETPLINSDKVTNAVSPPT